MTLLVRRRNRQIMRYGAIRSPVLAETTLVALFEARLPIHADRNGLLQPIERMEGCLIFILQFFFPSTRIQVEQEFPIFGNISVDAISQSLSANAMIQGLTELHQRRFYVTS